MIFLGVADEETGGALGAGFMVEQHFDLFAHAGVVLNEGGYIATDSETGAVRYYAVETAQKVPLWLRLTATGSPGHGSTPRADSAPSRLLSALARIESGRPAGVVPSCSASTPQRPLQAHAGERCATCEPRSRTEVRPSHREPAQNARCAHVSGTVLAAGASQRI